MSKKLAAFPKSLHAGRKIRVAGKDWIVKDAYSERLFGSEKVFRTVTLVLFE